MVHQAAIAKSKLTGSRAARPSCPSRCKPRIAADQQAANRIPVTMGFNNGPRPRPMNSSFLSPSVWTMYLGQTSQ
jgi:hypothetical protein